MLTEAQYEIMTRCGTKRIILCLDSDPVNKDVYERIVSNVIKDKKDIEILIKELPYLPKEEVLKKELKIEGSVKDPDSVICAYGVEHFKAIPEVSLFEYRLGKLIANPADTLARDNVLFAVLREESVLQREAMCRQMASKTEYSFDAVKDELNRLNEQGIGGTGMMYADIIREKSLTNEAINEFEEWAWKRTGDLLGLNMGFPIMTRQMDGLQQGMWLVGGKANVGKSAFFQQLCLNILAHNVGKVHVLFFTIDDDVRKMLPRLIASQSGIPINTVTNPVHKMQKNPQLSEEGVLDMEKRRERAVNSLREMSEHLCIRDASQGKSLEYIGETIRRHKFIAADKQLVVFIDNLHKIKLGTSNEKGKEKFTIISEELKELANKLNIPIVCTAELKKSQDVDFKGQAKRPTEEDLKETADLSYDADVVFLVYNEMHHFKEKAKLKHLDPDTQLALPVLEIITAKNKVSSFKGTLMYKFWPSLARLEEANVQEHTTRMQTGGSI
jgi:replicative DNA helicase